MKFTFTEKKVSLPQSVHNYAEKKVGKLERYFKIETEALLVFSVEKERNKVEVTIRSGGTVLRASESTSDMFASIDTAVSSIERQLRKNKSRLEKRLRQGIFEPGINERPSVASTEEEQFDVVRTKRFALKPMTVDEAILQMNLLNHTFFAFRNEDVGGAFAVVYKRNDDGYGLICDEK